MFDKPHKPEAIKIPFGKSYREKEHRLKATQIPVLYLHHYLFFLIAKRVISNLYVPFYIYSPCFIPVQCIYFKINSLSFYYFPF